MNDATAAELVERRAFEGWYQACRKAQPRLLDWSLVEVGDALCSISAAEPSILVNRVFGLGSASTPTLEQLKEIGHRYRDAGVSRFFLHVLPDRVDAATTALLTDAGYRKYRGWMKFKRGPDAIRAPQTDLKVRRMRDDEAQAFATIVADAFDFRESSQPAIAALAGDSDWHLYMSFAGDTPAGTGGLYMRDGTGYLDWGATHPDFRRRGGQTAILSRRLKDAFAAGCTSVVTMTGEAVPGDEQHSYRNILKAGFAEDYLRENWIPRT